MAYAAFGLVLISGFVHSVWNLFAKRSINKHAFLWLCCGTSSIMFLPFVWSDQEAFSDVDPQGWVIIAASVIIHGVYIYLLATAYKIGDLSQVYPIMRGTSPLLVPVFGVLLLNERLQLVGWIGIACIVIGIVRAGNLRVGQLVKKGNHAVYVALMVGALITAYTVVDKVAIRHVPPQLLTELTNIGNFAALTLFAIREKGIAREWRVNWPTILLGGILSPGGYILFLMALEMLPVSQLAPMREIGTVFGTLMGVFLLREPQGKQRIWASVLITAGIVLLARQS
ncbi:DMT family transporter [Cohnella panacarvi]|uniref:DMT family transporter n=1 Tax=Cohnella panacarvi TaxID=400776 RepID=UPI00047C3DDF|nr:DMT family transporter [Cohnella panacarvi]